MGLTVVASATRPSVSNVFLTVDIDFLLQSAAGNSNICMSDAGTNDAQLIRQSFRSSSPGITGRVKEARVGIHQQLDQGPAGEGTSRWSIGGLIQKAAGYQPEMRPSSPMPQRVTMIASVQACWASDARSRAACGETRALSIALGVRRDLLKRPEQPACVSPPGVAAGDSCCDAGSSRKCQATDVNPTL